MIRASRCIAAVVAGERIPSPSPSRASSASLGLLSSLILNYLANVDISPSLRHRLSGDACKQYILGTDLKAPLSESTGGSARALRQY